MQLNRLLTYALLCGLAISCAGSGSLDADGLKAAGEKYDVRIERQ